MASLPKRIMEHAEALPEAAPICPGALLHLGNRAAVDQALSRLARRGQLLRVCRGVYMRPIETRFGIRAPYVERVIGVALGPLGRDDRSVRGGCSERAPANHAGTDSIGVPYLGTDAHVAALCAGDLAPSCATLATGGAGATCRSRHSSDGVARSARDRRRPRGHQADALRNGSCRTRCCSGYLAVVDCRTREHFGASWIASPFNGCPRMTSALCWVPSSIMRGTRRICLRRTSGSFKLCPSCSTHPSGADLVFKGGTSLSKAYQAIRRFSEDVDVTYDIRRFVPRIGGRCG